jgi:hypothetical protein
MPLPTLPPSGGCAVAKRHFLADLRTFKLSHWDCRSPGLKARLSQRGRAAFKLFIGYNLQPSRLQTLTF